MRSLFLLSALMASMGGSAVTVNPKGVGQALVYPLFLTGDNDTLITLTNETANVKALKVSVHDYAVGAPILRWNVYLKAYDTFTMTVTGDPADPPFISVPDGGCTVPLFDGPEQVRTDAFAEDAFVGQFNRTAFGYVEAMEMGEVSGLAAAAVEANRCGEIADRWRTGGIWRINSRADMSAPMGGISGTSWIIDVEFGDAYGLHPTALTGYDDLNHTRPESLEPTLLSLPPNSDGLFTAEVDTDLGPLSITYGRPEDAVSAALMTTVATADFTVEEAILGLAVLYGTAPTMRYYVESRYSGQTEPRAPFDTAMSADGAPHELLIDVVTREGVSPDNCDIVNRVEQPSALIGPALHNTAVQAHILSNRVNFSSRSVANRIRPRSQRGRFAIAFGGGAEDWMRCGTFMDLSHRLLSPGTIISGENAGSTVQLSGLPVIMSQLQKVVNGSIQTSDGPVRANYGVTHAPRKRVVAVLE